MPRPAASHIPGVTTLLAALLAFCGLAGAAAGQSAAPPVPASKDWKRLGTSTVNVVGNATEQELRTALRQIEDFRAALVALFPGMKLSSRHPTTMVVLRDFNTFRNFQPRDDRGRRRENVGGYFTTTPQANYMVLGAFGDRDATLETVFHEYTHFVLRQNFGSLPTWVDEGLADFYSTFRSNYKNGQSLVGLAPRARVATLRERGLMPIERILTSEGVATLFRDPNATAAFYAQSWAFVHYVQLGNDGQRRGQIGAYLSALDRGLAVPEAFNAAFHATFEEMQRELSTYVRRVSFPALVFSPKAPAVDLAGLPVERLSESDAAYLQADLLLQVGATEDAERLVTHALIVEPSHTDAKIALARVRARQDGLDKGIATLAAITAERPETFSAHLYLAGLLRLAGRYDEAMHSAERAVALDRESTQAWNELSLSALASGRDKEAEEALAQLLARDSDPAWYRTRTYDAYRLGRDEAVVRSAAAYVRVAGQGNEASPYVGYAAAIASMRLDRQPEAAAIIAKIEDSVPLGSWQSLVAQFLQGQFSAEKLLEKAKSDAERTEAHAYIGALNAAIGRNDEALVHLRWVKEHGLKNYVEYGMALADLGRLEAAKAPR